MKANFQLNFLLFAFLLITSSCDLINNKEKNEIFFSAPPDLSVATHNKIFIDFLNVLSVYK